MSFLFCCFKTFSTCGFRDCMINSAAFQPPTDRKYNLKFDRHDLVKGPIYRMILYDGQGKAYEPKEQRDLETSVVWLDTKTHKQIPAVFIENKNCQNSFVILYSHGNSTDLGRMYKTLQDLSQALNVHVFAYEYNGYGPTQGSASEIEIIFGIMAAYDYLINRLCFLWPQIILYGRSIGSGPSVFLASHPEYPVSGVILHSPIASGFKVLNFNPKPGDKSDLFPNADFVEHVKAHVYVMHGEQDEEVAVSHGKLIASRCRNLYSPWWVQDGTHNDIDYNHKRPYYIRLGKFLRHVRDFNVDKTGAELEEFYSVEPWWNKYKHMYFTKIQKVEEKHLHYLAKNRKKTLKSESYSISSVTSKSMQMHAHNTTQPLQDDNGEEREAGTYSDKDLAGGEQRSIENRMHMFPKWGSKSFNYKLKNLSREIEFNSFQSIKDYDDLEGSVGPRDVKFGSEKMTPFGALDGTEPTDIENEETFDRLTDKTGSHIKQIL